MSSIKINFCGDFVSEEALKIEVSPELAEKIKSGDINVVNFEAPLSGYGVEDRRSGPKLHQPISSYEFLLNSGFNLFQLANNHMLDYGEKACKATSEIIKNSVGAGLESEAYSPKIIDVKGKKIAFLSLVHHEFGAFDDVNEGQEYGTAWINSLSVNKIISDTKKQVDLLVVLPHAGIELLDIPLPEWRERYKNFIDNGADLVVGTHPHVPQGWENYKEGIIFYSLGNFYFDVIESENPWWYRGLMLSVLFNDNKLSFEVYNTKFEKYFLSLDDTEETKNHNRDLLDALKDESSYIKRIDTLSLYIFKNGYKKILIRGLKAFSFSSSFRDVLADFYCMFFRKKDISLMLNSIQCESSRYIILRALRLQQKNC